MSDDDRLYEQAPALAAPPIVQYYEGGMPAARCVSAIRRGGLTWIGDADSQWLLGRLRDLDPDLGKTWTLVKGQASRDAPIGGLRHWLNLVVQNQAARGGQSKSPRYVVEDLLLTWAPLKGRPAKRAVHLLKLTILDMHWQRRLSDEPRLSDERRLLLENLEAAFVRHFVSARDSTEALERHVFVASLKCGSTPQFRAFSRTLAWKVRQSARQAEDLAKAQKQTTKLNADVAQLEGQVKDLEGQVKDLTDRVLSLEHDLQESRDSAILRLHDLSGQVSGQLNGRVDQLLGQANEALDMNEPRVRAAREFVETARDGIGALTQWLAAELISERPTV